MMFLMPMFDPRSPILGLPHSVAVMLGAVGLAVIGFLWLHRTLEPGPFVRGESSWRYRDRPRLQRIRQWLAEGDHSVRARTRGWWFTRLEFALAAVMALIATALLPAVMDSFASTYGGSSAIPMPVAMLIPLSGYAGIAFGIWGMRREYTAGLRADSEARWRYRDR
jgi:hypothetical protein